MLDKEILESEERAKKLEAEAVLKAFWSESENIVMKAPSGHKLKDIARYEVRVKENILPEGDLQELEADKKVLTSGSRERGIYMYISIHNYFVHIRWSAKY